MSLVNERLDEGMATIGSHGEEILQEVLAKIPDLDDLMVATGRSPTELLPAAIKAANLPHIKELLSKGAELTDDAQRRAFDGFNLDVYRILIPAGLDIDRQYSWVGNAMTSAIWDNDEDFVKFLLESGASPDGGEVGGQSAMDMAIEDASLRIVELMVEYGAELTGDFTNYVLLATAYDEPDKLEFLVRKGCDINENSKGKFVSYYRNRECNAGHIAAIHYEGVSLRTVDTLIRLGLDCTAKDVDGKTAYEICCSKIPDSPDGEAADSKEYGPEELLRNWFVKHGKKS